MAGNDLSQIPTEQLLQMLQQHPDAQPEQGSALGAYASDVAKIPGAAIGTPRFMLYDVPNWLNGEDGKNPTDPLAKAENAILPSSEGFNDAIGLTPHLVDHKTLPGKLTGAFIEGGGLRALMNPRNFLNDLKEIGKTGLATSAAAGANEVDPGNLGLQLATGFITHAAAGLGGRTLAAANKGLVRPFWDPERAGAELAGSTMAKVDNTQPGLANPSSNDLTNAAQDTRNATDAFGPGVHPPAAMGDLRGFLDLLKGHLESAKEAQIAPYYNRFRAEPLMDPPEALTAAERATRWPLGLPDVAGAMHTAGRNMVGDTGGPRAVNNPYGGPLGTVNWTDFNTAGDPVYKTSQVPTPDLLDRTKRQLNIRANQSASNSGPGRDTDTAASRMNQAHQVGEFTKGLYPDSYPQALDATTRASVPITPFDHPIVAKMLDAEESANGKASWPKMESGDILDHIATSKSPGEVVGAAIDAAGDRGTVLNSIQDAIVGHLRETPGVIDPATGEVNAKALDTATRKYMPTIGMYFPELQKKFGDAKSAQSTLDTMRSQDALVTTIRDGGLRDGGDIVTPKAAKSWLGRNEKQLAQTQSPAAVMRLREIVNALPEDPFHNAERTAQAAPGAVGVATGHGIVEGGFAGTVIGRVLRGPLDARIRQAREAYSAAVERAFTDPAYAADLARRVRTRPPGMTSSGAIINAIAADISQAAKNAPLARAPSGAGQ